MLDRLMADPFLRQAEPVSERYWQPLVDIREDKDSFVVHAEIPGMKLEDIDIELSGDSLTIRGERKLESEEKKENYVRVERRYGSFLRTFNIGCPIQSEKVEAQYKDGILSIVLPKAEEIKPKKVSIKG
jgi:HSP20 family protein